jgi:uncharacterized protein
MTRPVTSRDEQRELLRIVREAIGAHLRGGAPSLPPLVGPLARRVGLFVTLHLDGDLRGCIGHPDGDQPLGRILIRCAIAAATEDPRFESLTLDEFERVRIELSLIAPIEPVADVAEIQVGRHGLIVEQGGWRGLLLPQVASEHEWDRETFLAHTCLKAGLRADAWKAGARLFKFEAEVFGDEDGVEVS